MGTMGDHPHRHPGGAEEPMDAWDPDLVPLPDPDRGPAPMSAWLRFAAIVVIMTGVFNAIEGLVGLFDSGFYLVRPNDILLFGLTGWSWVHLAIGCLVAFAGVALFAGAAWARPLAIVLATVNAVTQLVFIAIYPLWSLIVIALCFLVIWVVVVHGDDGDVDL
jgi:hypothetical protein